MAQETENMSISLPKELKELVRARVAEDHYGTPSDYLRSLIREDLKKRDLERLETLLLEGLRSGKGVTVGTKEWQKLKKTVLTRIAKKD